MIDLFGDDVLEDPENGWDEEDDFLSDFPERPDEPFVYHGNQNVIQQLNLLISSGRLSHALLFSGEQGVGKFTLAEAFAHSLLSGKSELFFSRLDGTLKRMRGHSHSDYLYISDANEDKAKKRSISIDQVRPISSFLHKTMGESPLRVIIIDGVESMNVNAANALLKNLEEPPHHSLIILISHNQASLLPTIRSRVQTIKFLPLTVDDCAAIIKSNSSLALTLSEEDIALVSDLADARPGLALTWLEAGAADIYRDWLALVADDTSEAGQLAKVVAFAESLTSDKQTIHTNMELFSALLLQFIKRAALEEPVADAEEKQAIEAWQQRAAGKAMIDSWFILKDQFSLVQGLHLEYRNTLTTMLLRVIRGQPPLEII